MALNTKTFVTRAASAAVFVALLLGCVWYSYYSFVAFFTLVGLIGLHEFYKLSQKLGVYPSKWVGFSAHIIIGILLFTAVDAPIITLPITFTFIISFFFFVFLIELFKKDASIQNVSFTLMSWFYITIPCLLITLIAKGGTLNFAPQKVIGMIFFIWINDTGAYLTGSFIGKHKMYERISPGKTWEGTIGGVILTMSLAYVVYLIFPELAYRHWLAIAAIVAVFGTLGDLVESMLKRQAGVKDSGNIMPGHGGVLDRFDSLFFSTPFVFAYLAIMGLL